MLFYGDAMQHNSSFNVYMQADRQALIAPAIDIKPLIGSWLNVNDETQYLVKIAFRTENGCLWLRTYGANDPNPIDWGEVEITPYISSASTQISGFQATYCFETTEIHFSGRFMGSIVEIMVNTRYLDDSGRTNHFSREFFRRSILDTSDFIDFKSVLGTWENSKPDSQGIRQFTLRQLQQQLLFHPQGMLAPEDWGEVEATPFIDAKGERAFLADYEFDTHKLYIAANTNKGLWILATHYVSDSALSQPNFLRREFFCCVDTSTK